MPLDASGRANVNIWLNGAYSVALQGADGTTIWTRDVDAGAGAGQTIPSLVSGQFLTNDGSNLLWSSLREVPDPTGSANMILSTDGSNLIWIPQPTIPDAPIEPISNGLRLGGKMLQWGSGSAPASGGHTTSTTITFPTPFDATPFVVVSRAGR